MNKIKVREYATLKGISPQAVYKLIKNKQLKSTSLHGTLYVILTPGEFEEIEKKPDPGAGSSENLPSEILKVKIEMLERENDFLKKQLQETNERLKESNILNFKTIEALKSLENIKDDKKDVEEVKTSKNGLFSRIFGK